MTFKTTFLAAAATAVMAFGGAASAATFNVVDNPGGQALTTENGIANLGTFSQALTVDDAVSITFEGSGDETSVGIAFKTVTTSVSQMFELVFTGADFGIFGPTDIYLSTSASTTDAFDSGTITGAGDLVTLSGVAGTSPFFVLFELTSPTTGSFTGDLRISAVPLPAGILLMGTALGGLGLARRRKCKKTT